MRIKSLYIKDFKNLRDFSIDFDKEHFTTIIVGQNGTGKSNILEALIIIFRDLDLGDPPQFAYQLNYLCHGNEIKIDADPARSGSDRVRIQVKGEKEETPQGELIPLEPPFEKITPAKFRREARERYLPRYVFGYYSGPSNRMEQHFEKHQDLFYKQLINMKEEDKEPPIRPLLYARHEHSQFVLLAFFDEQDETITNFLRKHLRIEGFDSALFVMRQPLSWKSAKGDSRFWFARGYVQLFLDKLYKLALVPLNWTYRVNIGFRKERTLGHLYLYVKDTDVLKKLAVTYTSPQEFFKALESTYISELLSEVRIKVMVRNADGSLTWQELSEGEQQLLMVLGLLRFTKEDESLFLLDEPDTHLNPAWSMQYHTFLKEVVGEQPTSHILMTTHDPLVVAGVGSNQVKIFYFEKNTDKIKVDTPEVDPNRMDYAGILTSEIFGLRAIVPPEVLNLIDEKNELAAKEKLSQEDINRLAYLNQALEEFDISSVIDDPYYEPFIRAYSILERDLGLQSAVVSKEDQELRQKIAAVVLDTLQKQD